jgi:hypothetical protein
MPGSIEPFFFSLKYTFRHTFFKSLKNAYEIFRKDAHQIEGPSLDFIARLRTFAHIHFIAWKLANKLLRYRTITRKDWIKIKSKLVYFSWSK